MRPRTGLAAFVTVVGVAGALAAAAGPGAQASTGGHPGDQGARLIPGDLLVSTSTYVNDPNIVAGTTVLPPGSGSAGAVAIAGGSYPQVFNNVTVDASFGVTSKLYLQRAHAVRAAAGRHPGAEQRPGHQLLVQVRGRAQPLPRRQVRHVHRLRGRPGHH